MVGDPVGVGVAEADGVTEGAAEELELGVRLVVGEAEGDVVGRPFTDRALRAMLLAVPPATPAKEIQS
jgi:hypothetical protein